MTIIRACNSFKDGKCQERLEYYLERDRDEESLTIEKGPCPFYIEDESCRLDGHIGLNKRGYSYNLRVYEKRGDKTVGIERTFEIMDQVIFL